MLLNVALIFSIGLVAIVSPGPDFFLLLRNSFRGPRAAMETASGFALGCLIQISACVLGVSALLRESPELYEVVTWLGALYLIYLGVKGLWYAVKAPPLVIPSDATLPVRTSFFREGLLNNLLNPKFTLFLLSVFAQFTNAETSVYERIVYGATLWIQGLVYWHVLAALLQNKSVAGIAKRFGRIADPVLAVLLLTLGLRLIIAR